MLDIIGGRLSITGDEIRKVRTAFGWSIDQFARVLGVHPVTLNRWELVKEKNPQIEGMAFPILMGLRDRVLQAEEGKRAAAARARETGQEIEKLLLMGGVLLALAALLAFANEGRK